MPRPERQCFGCASLPRLVPSLQRLPSPQEELDDARTYAIIGAAIEVHRALGAGLPERAYHLALGAEFRRRGILHDPDPAIPVAYKGEVVGVHRPSYVCLETVLVELRAQSALTDADAARVLSALRSARLDVGLLLNFGTPLLEKRRFAPSWRGPLQAMSDPSYRASSTDCTASRTSPTTM